MAEVYRSNSILGDIPPSKSIVKLAIPATLALLAKAIYNLVDTAYIGMLNSDIALTAVGVTVPLLLIMVSIENIFAAGNCRFSGAAVRRQGQRRSQPYCHNNRWLIGYDRRDIMYRRHCVS